MGPGGPRRGWWLPYREVCVVADRPQVVHTQPGADGDGMVLHREDGPAVVYRDGLSGYFWRGRNVPRWVIEEPTPDRIRNEPGPEIRLAAFDTLTTRTGHVFDDHLDRTLTIPVLDGLQAQGDLLVIPAALAGESAEPDAEWHPVPPEGHVLLDGVHPHVLVADPGTCLWTDGGLFAATAPVYLMHPEHGATGLAPGAYVTRRQREWRRVTLEWAGD